MLLSCERNREQIIEIARENSVNADIVPKFSLDKLHDSGNFISLLFYPGLVTIDDSALLRIKIPNQSIRVVFWEFVSGANVRIGRRERSCPTRGTSQKQMSRRDICDGFCFICYFASLSSRKNSNRYCNGKSDGGTAYGSEYFC
ncbi:MAG: hypothetical protein LBC48_01195 [Dysgonamonadaceae bacterium]|jgi:hypothetical protein|nr:hypothetical protein [Dysgonamonadaceae bacterium]